jgi:shikimate kinase
VAEVFASEGEAGFRQRESVALQELAGRNRLVIATGGGAVLRLANRDLLRTAGFVAWLTARPETLWARLQADPATLERRPNLTGAGGVDEILTLLAVREPLYRSIADLVVDTDGPSPEQVAATIFKSWPGYRSSRS